jgi:hypothetical protein
VISLLMLPNSSLLFRYLENGFSSYWDNGNVEAALSAHPTLQQVHTA